MSNLFYEIPINVEPGEKCDMPDSMVGAYVNCYVGADDVNEALQKCVDALRKKGYIFTDILDQTMELDPNLWKEFVSEAWPEIMEFFPTQNEVKETVSQGEVFFGPFVGYMNK